MLRITAFLLLISSLVLLTFGCSSANQRDNTQADLSINLGISDNKIIKGKVVKKINKEVFLELIGDSKNISDKISVGIEDEKMLINIEEGQNVLVWYDYIRESYPPQTKGLKIEHMDSNE